MKILALDTSCMMGSVAVVDGQMIVAEQLLNIKITHSERLIASIDALLEAAELKLHDMDAFAVAIGPGSFTGLRIGLAAAKGFAFVTEKPILGVSTLLGLAYNVYGSREPVVAVLDARRGEYYVADYRFEGPKVETHLADTVMKPEELATYIESLNEKVVVVGDGVYSLHERTGDRLKDQIIVPPPSDIHPRASNIAHLAMERAARSDFDDLDQLAPNYIRKSDAELTKRRQP